MRILFVPNIGISELRGDSSWHTAIDFCNHGIGRMFASWMEGHLGREQMEVLRALKRHFDPNNILNPGIGLME